MKQHVVRLWRYNGTLAQYARANSLQPDPFIIAFKQHFPRAWADYVRERGEPERRQCAGCGGEFYPANGNQSFCSPKCANDRRRDIDYFGGQRRATIGLAAGVCQVCGGRPTKGLSSHHVIGKENDPENAVLVALCRGCHQLVTTLAQRLFVDDPSCWEALIALVWLRRHAGEAGDDLRVDVTVTTATKV